MAIHQEALIDATPMEVYTYLTDGEAFAAGTGMAARLQATEGSEFALFNGRIEGRQIELSPGERVVQAWRFGDAHPDTWAPGLYSIVRFTLAADGARTRLVIDHDALPAQWQEHLAGGYPTFYQAPMARYFADRAARG